MQATPRAPSVPARNALRAATQFWEQGDVARALPLLRNLFVDDPAGSEAANLLAKLLQSQGMLTAACEVMARHCRASFADADLCLRCAQFVQQCSRHTLAAQLCAESFARGVDSPALLALAGNIARERGAFEQARDFYRQSLARDVDLNAWYVPASMTATQRYTTSSHPDFVLLEDTRNDRRLTPRARAAAGFGLGKARDDVGDRSGAVSAWRSANALVRDVVTFSPDAWRTWLAQRKRTVFVPLRENSTYRPIFIVGLPRTGTTLAAVKLAERADVRDRGELPHIAFIAERLLGGGHAHDAEALSEAAALYRAHTVQDDASARWYLDQNPLNFRHLDLIAALFPNAVVIHCRRNRRDTALSIWAQDFAHPDYAFAYDFDGIDAFAAGHDALMQHWRNTLTLPIHTLDYEALAADPRASIDGLLACIGADSESISEKDFDEAAITSASMWQARQPIYTTSIARWRGYANEIPELLRFADGSGA